MIVVDDGSTDGSSEAVQARFPEIELVCHEQNRGFSSACWTGAQAAAHPWMLLLNSDAWPDKDAISLLAARTFDDSVFAVAPTMVDMNGKPYGDTVHAPYWERGLLHFERWSPPATHVAVRGEPPLFTLFGIGGGLLLRRDRFIQLGGFESIFKPFYHEDTDLCYRAWRRGWTVVVEPRSVVYHETGATILRRFSHLKVRIIRKRNRILLQWVHLLGRRRCLVHNLGLLSRLAYKWLTLDVAFYAAFALALLRLPAVLPLRRRERLEQVCPEDEIFARIRGSVEAYAGSTSDG